VTYMIQGEVVCAANLQHTLAPARLVDLRARMRPRIDACVGACGRWWFRRSRGQLALAHRERFGTNVR
jgi:hypothetical protein